MKSTVLRPRRAESLFDELEAMRRQIMARAYDIFKGRGGASGHELDDWVAAERQTVWTPAVEMFEKGGAIVVEAALAGVEPRDLDIQVTPDTLLIKSEIEHVHTGETKGVVHLCEFQPGRLFRLIRFPKRIDPDAVKAEYRQGLLRLTAAVAVEKPATTVEVQAA
jgi:HSP20 family protein